MYMFGLTLRGLDICLARLLISTEKRDAGGVTPICYAVCRCEETELFSYLTLIFEIPSHLLQYLALI
jgi:hypothetical protein